MVSPCSISCFDGTRRAAPGASGGSANLRDLEDEIELLRKEEQSEVHCAVAVTALSRLARGQWTSTSTRESTSSRAPAFPCPRDGLRQRPRRRGRRRRSLAALSWSRPRC